MYPPRNPKVSFLTEEEAKKQAKAYTIAVLIFGLAALAVIILKFIIS